MYRWCGWLWVLIMACGVTGAGEPAPIRVVAGVPPIGWLAQQLGGDRVQVQVLVEAGSDPHLFEVSPRQSAALHRGELFLSVGLPFEEGVEKKLKGTRVSVVDLAAAIPASSCVGGDEHDHHDHGHAHEDQHLWLSPLHLKQVAAALSRSLALHDAAHAEDYARRLKAFQAQCDLVHAKLQQLFQGCTNATFYVFHPAFGHFAEAYGLQQKSVEFEGKTPGPRHLATLVREARKDRVRVLFAQPQFDRRSAETIAQAIGARIELLDPLQPDVLAALLQVGTRIRAALPADAVPPGVVEP